MNNIQSQELARAVVTDGSATGSAKAATSNSQSGKVLPENAPQEPSAKQVNAESAAKNAAKVEQAVAKLNDYVQSLQRDLRFSVDDELGRAVVTVIDRQSQEVIRQIPNETALRLARNLNDQIQQQADVGGRDASASASLGLINTRI